MKIGILSPSIYMYQKKYRQRIYAPGELATLLSNTLVATGHDVYFFTAPDVKSQAQIISVDTELLEIDLQIEKQQDTKAEELETISLYETKKYYEMGLTQKAYEFAERNRLEVMHVFNAFGNLAHYFAELTGIPSAFTLHTPAPEEGTLEYWRYQRFSHHNFIAISQSQQQEFKKALPGINIASVIYHGVYLPEYTIGQGSGGYYAFIGRLMPEKGVDIALQATLDASVTLKLATAITPQVEATKYYQEKVLPLIGLVHAQVLGVMTNGPKIDFLKHARACVLPQTWDEPFGMVFIESMAVGTPIITFKRGSASEIVKNRETGFLVEPQLGVDGIKEAIKKIQTMSESDYQQLRKNCRLHVEATFTAEKMSQNHIQMYQKIK